MGTINPITMLAMIAGLALLIHGCRALTANAPVASELGEYNELPVKSTAVLYEGAMGGLSAGYVRALTAGDRFCGHVFSKVTGGSTDGAVNVRLRSGRYKLQVTLASVAITDLKKPVYASDDATLTLVPTGNSYVGRVYRYVANNTAIVEFDTTGVSDLAYSATAAGTALTNSTSETTLGAKTISGADLRVGDVIRVLAQVIATATNSTDTLTLKLYVGTEEIVTTGAVDVANGDIGYINCDVVVRSIGASGKLAAAGLVALGVPGTVTAKPFLKAEASEDISGDVAVAVKGTWSVANAGNSCRLDVMNVQVLKA